MQWDKERELWSITLSLPEGRYEYAFLIDGQRVISYLVPFLSGGWLRESEFCPDLERKKWREYLKRLAGVGF